MASSLFAPFEQNGKNISPERETGSICCGTCSFFKTGSTTRARPRGGTLPRSEIPESHLRWLHEPWATASAQKKAVSRIGPLAAIRQFRAGLKGLLAGGGKERVGRPCTQRLS